VQALLGHANLATTQIYTHVDAGLLQKSHRKYLPVLGRDLGRAQRRRSEQRMEQLAARQDDGGGNEEI